MTISERIAGIKEKLETLKKKQDEDTSDTYKINYVMAETATEEELKKFEDEHKIKLPEDYREFLLKIGNGGAGPFYGLFSLQDGTERADEDSSQEGDQITNALEKDFPISNKAVEKFVDSYNAYIAEGDDDKVQYFDVPEPMTGVISLCDYGCGWTYILVVKGEQVGKVWFAGDYLSPCPIDKVQWSFLDWYEDWVNASIGIPKKEEKFDKNANDKITIINYDGWKKGDIPETDLVYKNLKKLVFSRNDAAVFPEKIFQFTHLKNLDLSMNPFIEVPAAISDLKDLVNLQLNYNFHVDLPSSMDQLKKLETLSMYNNCSLEKIPEVVGRISSLKKLSFSYDSKLKKVPENIGDLKNLETLELNNCSELEVLPDSISKLTNLQSIWLGGTKLKKLPEGFEKLTNLISLGLDIEMLDLEDAVQKIKNLPKLTSLTLVLQLQYPESFKELKNIKSLFIESNYGLMATHKTLPVPEQTTLMPNVEYFELTNNNQANALPENIGDMKNLKNIDLCSTAIKKFPESFKNLPKLEKIRASTEADGGGISGLVAGEKEKVTKWFPKAKIWIY